MTDFTGDLPYQMRVEWAIHQGQSLFKCFVGKDIQKRRLTETDSDGLFQGVVKDGVARSVSEICDDNGVFVGEFGRTVGTPIEAAGVERGCRTGFTPKTFQGLRIAGQYARQKLEGDETAQFEVFRLILGCSRSQVNEA